MYHADRGICSAAAVVVGLFSVLNRFKQFQSTMTINEWEKTRTKFNIVVFFSSLFRKNQQLEHYKHLPFYKCMLLLNYCVVRVENGIKRRQCDVKRLGFVSVWLQESCHMWNNDTNSLLHRRYIKIETCKLTELLYWNSAGKKVVWFNFILLNKRHNVRLYGIYSNANFHTEILHKHFGWMSTEMGMALQMQYTVLRSRIDGKVWYNMWPFLLLSLKCFSSFQRQQERFNWKRISAIWVYVVEIVFNFVLIELFSHSLNPRIAISTRIA